MPPDWRTTIISSFNFRVASKPSASLFIINSFLSSSSLFCFPCKKGKECKRMHFSKGQCSIEAAHAACDRIWEPMGTEIRAEIANQPSFFRK